MARLSEIERTQLRQASRTKSSPGRPVRQSLADYLAFVHFAARFAPADKPKPIAGGSHWKL